MSFRLFSVVFLTRLTAESQTISLELKPEGIMSPSGSPVIITMKGKVYGNDCWFDEAGVAFTPSEDEQFIMKVVDMNGSGTPEEVLSLWSPDERDEMRSLITNADLFRRNQSFYQNIKFSCFALW
jgi:hypothetical protein